MPRKPKHPLVAQVHRLPKGLTEQQANKAGLMAADQVVTIGLCTDREGKTEIEVRGMNADATQMDAETLFHAWLMFAQLIGQMPQMPIEQRQLAMHAIHHWHHHTAPVPVNPGFPV